MIDTQHIAHRLAAMAMDPAFVEITRHTTKQIMALHPDQFRDLGRDVAAQIEFLKEQQKSGG